MSYAMPALLEELTQGSIFTCEDVINRIVRHSNYGFGYPYLNYSATSLVAENFAYPPNIDELVERLFKRLGIGIKTWVPMDDNFYCFWPTDRLRVDQLVEELKKL